MNIAFLTQYFPPEMGAPQARISELAIRLNARGHTVTVVTAMPNYPTGKIFFRYRGLPNIKEKFQGLEVLRCWIYPSKSANFFLRLFSYFSFVISSMIYGAYLPKQDVIVVESPPLFLGIAGIYLSRKLGAKLIFNVSDLWPDSAVELGIVSNKMLICLAKKLEMLCYKKAAAITGQSPTIVDTIKQRVSDKAVHLITNGVDINVFSPAKKSRDIRERLGLTGKYIFVYAGLFGIAQGLGQILDAAGYLKSNKDIDFLLIGDGPERELLQRRVKTEHLMNVHIMPPVLKTEIPGILASMDCAIIPLKISLKGAVPSKIYEAMASGLPVIFIGQGDGKRIIEDARAGIVINPGAKQDFILAIHTLIADASLCREMGDNGIKAAHDKFSRDQIAEHFLEVVANL